MHKIYYFYHFEIQDEILSSFMHSILYIINHKNDMIKKKEKKKSYQRLHSNRSQIKIDLSQRFTNLLIEIGILAFTKWSW
jgi:hypothetical protein